jgi:hypothetical protein
MALLVACPGPVTFTTNGQARCLDGWETHTYGDHSFNPATDIDPVLVAGAVGAGFFGLVPLWIAIMGVRKLVQLVR